MQAIILAAGMGRRLGELTRDNTKCMVKVNGVTLIERALRQLDALSLNRIVIVVGYQAERLKDFIGSLDVATPIVYVDNPAYERTNNIYSLSLASDCLVSDDTLLMESDLIFDGAVLEALMDDPRETLALVDAYEPWMDGTCVTLGPDDTIESFVPGSKLRFDKSSEYYKTVNVYKFSKAFSKTHYVPFLMAYQAALGENEYYEQVLRVIAMLDDPVIKAKRLDGQRWYEIDDIQDLDIAESIFTPDDGRRVELLQGRYGGFWRYPRLIDFCYLVNPYFPPRRMRAEMRASFDVLMGSYPSGMRVVSLLAAKDFGVRVENILCGNGAAELIKALMERLEGSCGFIRPTFDEYPNRYARADSVDFIPTKRDWAYTADDVMSFFEDKPIANLVLVNPENPTGNFIAHDDMLRLVEWCRKKRIRLIVDESFVDFADDAYTLVDQAVLDANPHLVVVKSISKSYGVPGLRLGILASGDVGLIDWMKRDVAIWNINSPAEFFLQIVEKYRADYERSLRLLRFERARFEKRLSEVPHIRVVPSQANFVMVELDATISPKELLKRLLVRHDLLVKELTTKTHGRNYLRLAIRDEHDDDVLVDALEEELGVLGL